MGEPPAPGAPIAPQPDGVPDAVPPAAAVAELPPAAGVVDDDAMSGEITPTELASDWEEPEPPTHMLMATADTVEQDTMQQHLPLMVSPLGGPPHGGPLPESMKTPRMKWADMEDSSDEDKEGQPKEEVAIKKKDATRVEGELSVQGIETKEDLIDALMNMQVRKDAEKDETSETKARRLCLSAG